MIRKGMFISDRYEIIDKVGSGGMSDVYKAKDHKLSRFVAIKVLKAEFSEDTNFVSKFKVEAQSAAGLIHPNIVNVYDVGEDSGIYYIVMELIEGITLKKYIEKKGKLPVKEAVSIAIQVSQGIEAAHNNHIIHRDIKPQNIMISREGKVKVTDFGIARAASAHTINGNAMGSVHYISPEQAKGGYIDEKSDIYSVGITLYEMITGEVPFEGDSTVSVALQHINEEMPNPRDIVEDLPISVEKIIEKCTQKKPERRYLKVSSLISDLKKSLITPDEDFVQLAPAAAGNNTTVLISEDEVSVVKNEAKQGVMLKKNDRGYEDDLDDSDDDFGDDDDIDSVSPKLDKIITISGIVGAIIVAVVVIVVLVKALGGFGKDNEPGENNTKEPSTTAQTISDKQTIVPNVVGKAEDDAIEMLQKAKLGFKIERKNDNTYPKGYVIEQSEEADAIIDKNSTVKLTVSDGPEKIVIPDVTNHNKDEAKGILEGDEYGLTVTIKYEVNDEVEAEKVIKTKPEANASAKYGDEIILFVSQGADTSDVKVPKLTDKTEETAKRELEELGLVYKLLKEEYDDNIDKGRIISQNIAADKSVPRGTEIGVVMSLGKKPEETTTEEPVTEEPTTEEPTTEEPTTESDLRTATIPIVSASKLTDKIEGAVYDATGLELTKDKVTGTISAELTYINTNGDQSTDRNIELASTEFNSEWKENEKSITKEAKADSEGMITYTLTYTNYVQKEDGTWEAVQSTVTYSDTVVFK